MSAPVTFAVVGHPNKGKSSVVAALTRQDQIAISEISGTTTEAQEFSLTLDGETLYTLIDTPGFQRPRQMLEHISADAPSAAERKAAISTFIANHSESAKTTGRFKDEIELLTPIINGANIIYVVDGSVPYSPEFETEMTILQWTGAPRMALINPISGEQYVDEWQAALGQYFSVVHIFNPMQSSLSQHLMILKAFEAIAHTASNTYQHIHQQLITFAKHQQQQAAFSITQFLAQSLALEQSAPLPSEHLDQGIKHSLQLRFKKSLTDYETQLQHALNAIYLHSHLTAEQAALDIDYPELFDQDYWYIFGLSRTKLITLSAAGAAAAGAALDIAVGGTSLLMGSLLGGISGAAASTWLSQAPDKVSIKNLPLGGKKITIGPIKNLQFAFVLLGRALNYQHALMQHSHANRDRLTVTEGNEWLAKLGKKEQVQLSQLLLKCAKGLSDQDSSKLQQLIVQLQSTTQS